MSPANNIGQTDPVAIVFFFLFAFISLGITYWAARRTRSTEDFYAAGRSISAVQNGFAVAGDFVAAAGFLGIGGFVSLAGFDGLIYAIGGVVAWPVTMFLLAEPLRNLGKYTVADVLTYRLGTTSVRVISAVGSLTVIFMYLIL
jgi:cation/acetate symporter